MPIGGYISKGKIKIRDSPHKSGHGTPTGGHVGDYTTAAAAEAFSVVSHKKAKQHW
jgi:hypothetical protein